MLLNSKVAMFTQTESVYQVGGSLPPNSPTYVRRTADDELYQALRDGEFCYVLNSRQMGKSSLRVQTMCRLQAEGFACAAIDLTSIISKNSTSGQLYSGLVYDLISSFKLSNKINLLTWWKEREILSPVKCFDEFIESVLLIELNQNLVIFIDEIDSLINLTFSTDDLFTFIRSCYNKRVDNPEYKRLSFVLLGVATPSDLIADSTRTPFNIGKAIEMTGFEMPAAAPLANGLATKVSNPEAILTEVLAWTGGQPFLTQKVCKLILTASEAIPAGDEAKWVEQLIQTKVINNWEVQDDLEHLKTIRTRIIADEQRAVRLLGLYQQILQTGGVPSDRSNEQMLLRLSGLVVRQQDILRVSNRIYHSVFNKIWVDNELANIRPYAKPFTDWLANNCQDTSRLLRGQALKDALAWAVNKSLSDRDYHFLTASQELDKEEALEKENQARKLEQVSAKLEQEKKVRQVAQTRNRIAAVSLLVLTALSVLALSKWQEAQRGKVNADINFLSLYSKDLVASNQELDALMQAVKAGKKLKSAGEVEATTKMRVVSVLQQELSTVREYNSLEGHNDRVLSISFSPDGKTLASASADRTIKLWSIDGTLLKTFTGHSDAVWSVSFSPDGKTIASASADRTIKLWSIDGTLLKTFNGHSDTVRSVSFSPDGKTIASASEDSTVKLWRLDGTLLQTFKGHENIVYSVSFSRDGQQLVTASADNTVRLWDLSGEETKAFDAPLQDYDGVGIADYDREGKSIVIAAGTFPNTPAKKAGLKKGDRISAIDGKSTTDMNLQDVGNSIRGVVNTSVILRLSRKGSDFNVTLTRDHITSGHNLFYNASISPDGKWIASASTDSKKPLILWSIDHPNKKLYFNGHDDAVEWVSFSPDGKNIASASDDKTVKLWNIDGSEIATFKGHNDTVNSVMFSPDGQTIASASYDNTIKLWKLNSISSKTVKEHKKSVFSVSFSPTGKTFASASSDKTIKLWKLDGTLLKTFNGHQNAVSSVSFSPDGNTIASASADKTVKLWSLDGTLLKTFNGHQGAVYDVSFSPDGKTIASASADKTVKLWNLDGTLLKTFNGHEDSVVGVSFSPDGKLIASASYDKTIKLWNLDGSLLQTFNGHHDLVYGVSFSPDGKTIASASYDKTIKLWSLDGHLIRTLKGHSDRVFGVNFSPDGKTLVSASSDKTIKLWSLDGSEIETLQGHT